MSTSTVPVKTAAEAALARADQPPDEPSDEELVIRARFVSSIRSGPKAEISGVYYCGQFMSLEAALAAEKADFLARAREALRKRREAEEQARAAALERQRQKAVFEADAAEARAQARLAEALTIYQHTLGELAEVNAQIDATRKEHTRASHDNRVPVDRLAADLGKLSGLIGALQIRASQLDETAKHQLEPLRECYRTAKAEFVFLHQKEREVHLKRAMRRLEEHFVLSESWKHDFAERAKDLLNLDTASGYSGHRYSWPYETITQRPLSSDQLIDAAKQLAVRFRAFQKTQQLYSSYVKS
jgi:hypothetical protein